VKVPQGFGNWQKAWAVKASFLFERFGKASALESKRQRGSATSFGSFCAWSLGSQGGGKLRPVGWSAFALRRRFWWAKAGFVWRLPGRVGADVFGQAGWQRQRFWRLRRRLVGQVLGNWGALVGERPFGVAEVLEGRTAVFVWRLPGRVNSDVVGKAVWEWQRFCRL
jgi:hypothetical protein